MTGPLKVYVKGAYIPRFVVNERQEPRTTWVVGNLLLTEDVLECSTKRDQFTIPLASVTAVTGPMKTVVPPPLPFEEYLTVHHEERGVPMKSMIAFPPFTVRNFPLQLAAMLTGVVEAVIPHGGRKLGDVKYETVKFQFYYDHFRVQRAVGDVKIPLKQVSSVTLGKGTDPDGRPFVEWVLDYVDGSELRSLKFISHARLRFLWALLAAVKGLRQGAGAQLRKDPAESLSETAQQVAVMLYTGGVKAADIETALGIPPEQLDGIYEDFLRRGMAEVVHVRKEIALNASGVKIVDDFMKKQMET
jgi:hypothetical protein